ncbi:zinc-dependent peptidase, partial [Ideonella sp.]|uniref:M90 family metallopeptidase n=1 Tax=Ideonella sp. TaxID=1929293 RepID=UPI003BB73515
LQKLREMSSLFLATKEFSGAHGLEVSDEMAVAIAAQACLPVLNLDEGLALYDGFVGIVLHPDEVIARREVVDDDGVVHQFDEYLAGEAMEGGPVMLSWADVALATDCDDEVFNVVLHEFTHVIDMADGCVDGTPPLPDARARARWRTILESAFETFSGDVERGLATLLDPYGAEAPSEFFAVAVECFFVHPRAFRQAHPELYELFSSYFKQEPAAF